MPRFTSRRPRPPAPPDDAPPPSPAEQAAACRAQALRMLERRSYSEAGLLRRLKEKGHAPDIALTTVQRVVQAGLVNDAIYARQVARTYLVSRRASVRRVQQEMTRRGVDRAMAAEAIAEVRVDEGLVDEGSSVERAARQKLRSLSALDPRTRARRLTAFLARRGFAGDTIRETLRRLDREAAAEGDADGEAED